MDEPSTALDPGSREDFFRLIEKLNKEEGVTVMIVTHDMDYVGHYANKLLMIDRKTVYFGPAEDFLHKHHITHHHDYAGFSHTV
jgi:zinc transport system ATP-binding protein